MEIKKKAELIADFYFKEKDNDIAQGWIKYHDIGIPLSISYNNDLIDLKAKGVDEINETWQALCDELEIDKDKDYDELQDLYDESRSVIYEGQYDIEDEDDGQ